MHLSNPRTEAQLPKVMRPKGRPPHLPSVLTVSCKRVLISTRCHELGSQPGPGRSGASLSVWQPVASWQPVALAKGSYGMPLDTATHGPRQISITREDRSGFVCSPGVFVLYSSHDSHIPKLPGST